MLTLIQCRKILGKKTSLSDSQLTTLRDQLYALADIGIQLHRAQKINASDKKCNAEWEERAAIVEFDGKQPRHIAERIASQNTQKDAHP